MDASPEFCFPPSIDARAVFFSFVGLGFVTPISPFFVCVIGRIWCFSVDTAITYMFSSCSLPLSLHDDCVISFFLSNTHTYTTLLHQILSPHSLYPLRDQITRTSSTLSLSPQSFRISTFTPLFQLLRFFLLSKKPKPTNHASTPFPPPGDTTPSSTTTITAPSPLHNSKQ